MRFCVLILMSLGFPALTQAEPTVRLLATGNLNNPFGGDFDAQGNHIIVEFGGHTLQKVTMDGKITLLAGNGKKGYKDGPAKEAQFNAPHNCVVHPKTGLVYIADTFNHAVRLYDPKTEQVSTILGTGQPGFSGDGGPGKEAKVNEAYHVALDNTGKLLYLADLKNVRIRQLNLETGIVTTLVGTGKKGAPADGTPAAEATLVDPRAVAVDSKNKLYILERSGHALRVLDNGQITTVVGTGKAGNTGDGGPAKLATMNGPKFLWVTPADDVILADTENHTIRKYNAKEKTITLLAGTGKRGKGDATGDPKKCALARPHGVAIAPTGSLIVNDTENNRILEIK